MPKRSPHEFVRIGDRPEARADAVRDGDHLARIEPVAVDHVGARELRHGDHARCAAQRAGHEAEERAIAPREQLRRARVRDVVHRHDGRAGQSRRAEVVQVRQGRRFATRERRERERDAPVRTRDVERQAPDGGRHVRGQVGRVAQRGGERELRRSRGQLAQQVDGVRLVTGASAPDRVAVDQDERIRAHCKSSRQSPTTDEATSSQLAPRLGVGRGCVSASRMPSAISSGEDGSK